MKTLYVSDLDGTLLNHAAAVKPRTEEMLNRLIKNGVSFSFSTARGWLSALRIMEKVNLKLPVIIMNGTFIVDPKTHAPIVRNVFCETAAELVKKFLLNSEETPLVYATVNGEERVSYLSDNIKSIKNYVTSRTYDKRMHPCATREEMLAGDIHYITLIDPVTPVEELDRLFNGVNGIARNYQRDTYNESEMWYEIFSEDATKANALRQLRELVGADEVVCFGDNLNDIPMFGAADRSYAVSNAAPEAKAAAGGIIGSNEACGVPVFIEREQYPEFEYSPREFYCEPNNVRFSAALDKARGREITTIGTLNEKLIHATLKNYYAHEFDHEAKIAGFVADAIGENGIYEIQTANFRKLADKLNAFLGACHVTVVYPFEKRTSIVYINKNTGELIKRSPYRKESSLTKLFLELYRLKQFLSNPNLTVCIAELQVDKVRYVDDEKCVRKRGQRVEKQPVKLLRELYIEQAPQLAEFVKAPFPPRFTKKEFAKLCRNCDAGLMLEVLECVGVVRVIGKEGNALIYTAEC